MKKVIGFIIFIVTLAMLIYMVWQILEKAISSNLNVASDSVNIKEGFQDDSKDGISFIFNPLQMPTPLDSMFRKMETGVEVNWKNLGEISPLKGKIKILKNYSNLGSSAKDANKEYVYIKNVSNQDIKISGFLLQSMITNKIAIVPQGVNPYILGRVNSLSDIVLRPNEHAILISGKSPLGVSFKTNACSGFLNHFRDFNPKLPSAWCPDPSKILKPTIENIKKYGDACFDAIKNLKRCEYFTSNNPYYFKVTKPCREILSSKMTYNACVIDMEKEGNLQSKDDSWYIYLGRDEKLWKDKYELIRLLDQSSRTIDYITY